MSNVVRYPVISGPGVSQLNGLTGSLSLVAGSNIIITPSGSDITIAATGGGGLPSPFETIVPTYSPVNSGSGPFLGADSDTNQADTSVLLGSTDTADAANLPSDVYITAGSVTNAANTANGGTIELDAGRAAGNGHGGNINVYAANSVGNGNGGTVNIAAGASGGSGNGGDITFQVGSGTANGKIKLDDRSGTITAGQVWTATASDGSGHWAAGGGGGATTALDNLASVAINAALTFNPGFAGIPTLNTPDVSAADDAFQLKINTGAVVDGGGGLLTLATGDATGGAGHTGGIDMHTGANSGTGLTSGGITIQTGTVASDSDNALSGSLTLLTGNNTGAGATSTSGGITLATGSNTSTSTYGGSVNIRSGDSGYNSGDVLLTTGNGLVGSNGWTGNIVLTTGMPDGTGTRGKIQFVNGTEGTSGYVWTSTDTAGTGAWMAASGGGATTALDNLASVAINTGLVFGPSVAGSIKTADNGSGNSQDLTIATGTASGTRGNVVIDAKEVHINNGGNPGVVIGGTTPMAGGDLTITGAGDAQISLFDSTQNQTWAFYTAGGPLLFQAIGGGNPVPLKLTSTAIDSALVIDNAGLNFGTALVPVGIKINGTAGVSGTITSANTVTVVNGIITNIV